jgi:hypothetical protein
MAKTLDYLAGALVVEMRRAHSTGSVNTVEKLKTIFSNKYAYPITQIQVEAGVRRLAALGLLNLVEDDYAGSVLRPIFEPNITLRLLDLHKEEELTELNKAVAGSQDLLPRVFSNPRYWSDLQEEIEPSSEDEGMDLGQVIVPASDRLVSVSHNQYAAIDPPLAELVEAVERDNGLPDEPGFRERVLGHIRAGREFLRAGIFEARLFYMTMIVGLRMLSDKYKDHVIGAMASKLLELILDQLGSFDF